MDHSFRWKSQAVDLSRVQPPSDALLPMARSNRLARLATGAELARLVFCSLRIFTTPCLALSARTTPFAACAVDNTPLERPRSGHMNPPFPFPELSVILPTARYETIEPVLA